MANRKLLCARLCIGLGIYLVALSYWLFWHSVSVRTWFRLETNISISCLVELLDTFDIKSVNISTPTYARLAQQVPISATCASLLPNAAPAASTNLTKLEMFTRAEQARMHSVVHQLLLNFTQRNLELFLCGGSLLGSVRHFGLFPWDADADLMIPSSQKTRARQLLVDLSASDEFRFVDTEKDNQHWQLGVFCQAERNKPLSTLYGPGRLYPSKQCKTIVDLFFGHTEGRLYRRLEAPFNFPITDVYPLRLRPYGPYLLPTPRHAERFLAAVYGRNYETRCVFKYFGHKSFACKDLRPVYPFVTHLALPYAGRLLRVDVLLEGASMKALFIPQQ